MHDDITPETLAPTSADTEGDGTDLSRVTNLDAHLSKSRRSILVRLAPPAPAPEGSGQTSSLYALSPPQARHLSRLLRRAVKEYLKAPRRKKDSDQK